VVQPNGTGWDRLEYVEQVAGGSSYRVEQDGTGLNRGVFRLGGRGWNSGQVSVQLNQSTCSKMGLQGRGTFACHTGPYRNHRDEK